MAKNPDWFLGKASEKKLTTERTLYVLAALTLALDKYSIKPILVGGGASRPQALTEPDVRN